MEFSPYFREYILASYAESAERAYTKIGLLVYLCVLTAIIGVGILANIAAIFNLVGALTLLVFHFKYIIAEKFGLNFGLPKLEEI